MTITFPLIKCSSLMIQLPCSSLLCSNLHYVTRYLVNYLPFPKLSYLAVPHLALLYAPLHCLTINLPNIPSRLLSFSYMMLHNLTLPNHISTHLTLPQLNSPYLTLTLSLSYLTLLYLTLPNLTSTSPQLILPYVTFFLTLPYFS